MRVAKFIAKGKAHIVEVLKVGSVMFAPGVWVLVTDLDCDRTEQELRWVDPATVHFEWIREFSS